ncbi:hypothetical protein ACGFR8_07680 [Streptomyces brevispora]|uniref:hypothetical protein n=1 Tax=Streptomyces brevispora TaxID=887462 RepID=UPI00371AC91B
MDGHPVMTDQPTAAPDRQRIHPLDTEIRALLAEGLPNSAISRRLYVGTKTVAETRAAAGIPPTPRSAWTKPLHPKERTIRVLLDEGYSNAEIRRRTGADVATVARRRKAEHVGPPTVRTQAPYVHPRDAEIRAMLRHHSNDAIADQLHVDRAAVRRIRDLAGVSYHPQGFATAEEKWSSFVRPVDDGHLEWTGERGGRSGTPVMRFREKSVSPSGIAFRKRSGRNPVGQVRPECGVRHCQEPDHVEDEPGRQQLRATLRAIRGLPAPSGPCRYGHDQTEHGLLEEDGTSYCGQCKREQKRPNTA